jgi:hypothetical protein
MIFDVTENIYTEGRATNHRSYTQSSRNGSDWRAQSYRSYSKTTHNHGPNCTGCDTARKGKGNRRRAQPERIPIPERISSDIRVEINTAIEINWVL